MGSTTSHDDKKTIDATGEVINNVVVQTPVEVQHTEKIIILLLILCTLKIISLIIYIYSSMARKFKKKYTKQERA